MPKVIYLEAIKRQERKLKNIIDSNLFIWVRNAKRVLIMDGQVCSQSECSLC